MQIVIDIPEDDYKFIKDLQFYNSGRRSGRAIEQNVINAIRAGIPYNEKPQGGWVRKVDVIQSIAKQYSEHDELVPMWLSIGNIQGDVK